MKKYPFNRIVYTGGLDYLPQAIDHLGIKQGFEMMGIEYYILDDVITYPDPDKLAEKIIEIQPDIIIYGETRPMGRNIPQLIKDKVKAFQIFWMMDYRPKTDAQNTDYDGGWNQWRQCAPYLDLLLLSNKEQLQWWQDDWCLPTAYLPHACWIPPRLYYNEKYNYDCVFIGGRNEGGWYGNRVKLLDQIAEKVKFEWINERHDVNRNKIWSEMPAIYHSANTVLDVSHSWTSEGYCSGRYFYTATLGGCNITKYFPGCEDLFPDGTKHYFDTPEEAVKLIDYYNSHPAKREKNKIQTAEYAWKHHNYKKRFEQVFEIAKSI